MIFVMRDDSEEGKEGSETTSLMARCGSAVIKHTLRDGDVFSECGTLILPGFRRFLSTICLFVVSTSHTGSLIIRISSASVASLLSPIRVFFSERSSFCCCC